MECGEPPADSELTLYVATPEAFSALVLRLLLPSKKSTVPVGVPPLPLTVAVNVTGLPASAGFCEEVTVVVLGAAVDIPVVDTPSAYSAPICDDERITLYMLMSS
jgi:hypothetical protein